MFQPKARRIFPVLALTAALFLAPLAAARAHGQEPAGAGLLAQIQAQIEAILDALRGDMGDAGPRMDDNG